MKKTILIMIIALLASFTWDIKAYGYQPTEQDIINSQLENIEFKEIEDILRSLDSSMGEYLSTSSFKEMVNMIITGDSPLTPSQFLSAFIKYIFRETVANTKILIQLIVLAVICAILRNMQNAFENEAISQLAYSVCYLVLIIIVIQSFTLAVSIGRDTITTMVSFMQIIMPILLVLLASIGGFTTASVLQPVVIVSVGIISTIIKTIVLPVIFFSAVLTIINNLSSKFEVSKLTSLLKQVSVALIGLVFTVFIGILTIQGIASSTVDGVSIRTAKFAVDKFVPVVGKFLSDSVDAIVGCSLLIKNSIGAVGLITLLLICFIPWIKILSLVLVYKISSAVIEPIGESNLAKCLSDISNCLMLVFSAVAAVAIMFFIAMTIVISAGSTTVMMR